MEPDQHKERGYADEIPSAEQRELEEELFHRARRVTREDERRALDETPAKISLLIESANEKKPLISRLIKKTRVLYTMLRDTSYSMSWQSKGAVIVALLYFINPLDIVPDFIPVIGYIDDAFIVSVVVNALAKEIDSYITFVQTRITSS